MSPSRRHEISLDGYWDLDTSQLAGSPEARMVPVPGSWTLALPGYETATGTVTYSRTFIVPTEWVGGELVLRFGAVNHEATVRVNGVELGGHQGAWTPFEFTIPWELLREAENSLEVEVGYPRLLSQADAVGMQEIPHGKQAWYGTNAGIWQPVTLEHRADVYIKHAVVRADPAKELLTATVELSRQCSVGTEVVLKLMSPDGTLTVSRLEKSELTKTFVLGVDVVNPRLWTLEDPALYTATISVHCGEHSDDVSVSTGFRSISTRNGQVELNGRAIEIRGILDQDYHPGSEYRSRTEAELEQFFRKVKSLGFNLLRCHIKRPDPMYFDIADRIGILVWAELPSWQRFTDRSAATADALLDELVCLDAHHPSIVVWSVINETWGIDLREKSQRDWMVAAQKRAKAATGALVVDNSACDPNFHVLSDLNDFHVYRGIPEHRAQWDDWVEEFAGRPDWTFSPHGDSQSTGEEPLIVSEFGNWGLPDIAEEVEHESAWPWWAEHGESWAFGAAHTAGVVTRFENSGLRQVFGDWRTFIEATQRQQLLATRYQLGALRRKPEIGGFVLTQLSDVQWEANGLFDMERMPRTITDELSLITRPIAVVIRCSRYSAAPGDILTVTIDIIPERGCHAELEDWELVILDGDVVERTTIKAGQRQCVTREVTLTRSELANIRAEIHVGGVVRAADSCDIVVIDPAARYAGLVASDDGEVSSWLHELGVNVVPKEQLGKGESNGVLVTRRFDQTAQSTARQGGRVLVLVEDDAALADGFPAPMLARPALREGDGDWVPRFDWLRRDGFFGAIPGGPLMDLAFEDVIGKYVIEYVPAPLRPAMVHSAVFAGWIKHAATTVATLPWSKGSVTLTTFRLREPGGKHPLASALMHATLQEASQ